MEEIDEGIDPIQQKIDAQKGYCKSRRWPLWAPKDGVCPDCGCQIYDFIELEEASEDHITTCPACYTDFAD